MRSELLEQLPLVEQRVQQVWVVMERVTQTGVYDLQHHSDHLLDDVQILSLRENHDAVNTDMITAINYISLFCLLPSGKCFRSMMAKPERLRRSFFPQASGS